MRALTIAGYLGFTAAAVALDLLARRSGSRLATISDVFGKLSDRRIGRVAVMLLWWWLGWHFFVR
ncbi:MAG TPA: DUF6186 family protein [Mycobacteriales bacterium]|jgi:hypothetical protein|nr:DUF6186 family protein [Mycobacteriales bacterium]